MLLRSVSPCNVLRLLLVLSSTHLRRVRLQSARCTLAAKREETRMSPSWTLRPRRCPQGCCPQNWTTGIAFRRTKYPPPKLPAILRTSPTSSPSCAPARTERGSRSEAESALPLRSDRLLGALLPRPGHALGFLSNPMPQALCSRSSS